MIRHVEALPDHLQALFYKAYPELKKEESAQENEPRGEALPIPLASPCQGVREEKSKSKSREEKSKEEFSKNLMMAQFAEKLCAAYPRKTHLRDTLEAAKDCVQRHAEAEGSAEAAFAMILAGTERIAAVVARWAPGEQHFLKQPPQFFTGDHWADDPIFWKSTKEKKGTGTNADDRNLGGRAPASEEEV